MAEFIKKKRLNYSIANTMFLMVACSFLLIISLVCAWVTHNQLQNVKTVANTSFDKTVSYINAELGVYVDNSIKLTTNTDFLKILRKTYPDSAEDRLEAMRDFSAFFNIVTTRGDNNKSEYLVYSDNPTLYRNKYLQKLSDIPCADALNSENYDEQSKIFWTEEDDNVFTFYKNIDNTGKYKNILRVEARADKINSYVQNCEDKSFKASFEKPMESCWYIREKKLKSEKGLWLYITDDYRNSLILKNIFTAAGVYFVFCGIFFVFVKFFTKRMTKDLYIFIEGLDTEALFTDFRANDTNKYAEFEIIKDKIINLILSIKKLHEKLEKVEEKRQKSEIELAQSKFNPHLLYNTLSVIKWSLIKGETDKLAPVIDLLTNYYRTVLRSDTVVELSEEIRLIKLYVHIMEITHLEKYDLIINTEPELEKIKIMRNTLQPLVENAVLHGLSTGGTIILSAYETEEGTVISVRDNGSGMTEEKIAEINSDNYESVYSNYGIKNTKKRLSFFFGKENFDFRIESRENEFTEIKLVIYRKKEL